MQHIPLSLDRLAVYYTLDDGRCQNDRFGGFGRFFHSHAGDCDNVTERVVLGGMPTSFPRDPKIKMVVSASTYSELAEANIPEDVEQVFVHIPDRTADVDNEDALDVVLQMREFLQTHPDEKILVHCKVGVGRSVMMCASLLTLFPDVAAMQNPPKDASAAFDYIQTRRYVAKKECDKLRRAEEVVALYQEQRNQYENAKENIAQDAAHYLSSLQGKDGIRRLRKFIELAIFGSKHLGLEHGRAVSKFFDTILHSEDGKWYEDLKHKQGPLFQVTNANDNFDKLVDGFTQQLDAHLQERHLISSTPGCNP